MKDITGIKNFYFDLLTKTEYEKYRENISPVDNDWWLKASGSEFRYAGFVDGYSHQARNDADVRCTLDIRPILRFKEKTGLNEKDTFQFGEHTFTVLYATPYKALAICNDCIGSCAFRKDYKAFNANAYTASDVRKYMEEWFSHALHIEKEEPSRFTGADLIRYIKECHLENFSIAVGCEGYFNRLENKPNLIQSGDTLLIADSCDYSEFLDSDYGLDNPDMEEER